jgi:hypothetical protein
MLISFSLLHKRKKHVCRQDAYSLCNTCDWPGGGGGGGEMGLRDEYIDFPTMPKLGAESSTRYSCRCQQPKSTAPWLKIGGNLLPLSHLYDLLLLQFFIKS